MQRNVSAGVSSTCTTCRAKKIKCDGSRPVCTACRKARNAVICDYVYVKPVVPDRELLKKGAACRACRRKKKKCDGKRPFCQTCVATGKKDLCEYDGNHQAHLTKILLQRTQELEVRLKTYEKGIAEVFTPSEELLFAENNLSSFTSTGLAELSIGHSTPSPPPSYLPPSDSFLREPWDSSHLLRESLNDGFPNASTLADPPLDPVPVFLNYSSPPVPSRFVGNNSPRSCDPPAYDSFDSSPWSSPEFQAYVSLIPLPPDPPADAFSSADDLWTYRCMFTLHSMQLGVLLLDSQLGALRSGDLSDIAVYPGILHCAHLWGSFFWQRKSGIIRQEEEAALCQVAVDAILSADSPNSVDLPEWLTACNLIAFYFFTRQRPYKGREFLFKASNAILQHNLRINQSSSGGSSRRNNAALYQLIYLDKYSDLVWKLPTVCSAQLDEDFKESYMDWRNVHFNPCPFLARTRSMAFLQSAKQWVGYWTEWRHTHRSATESPWFSKHWSLIQQIHQHIAYLAPLAQQYSSDGNTAHSLFFKGCIIMSLAVVAQLYNLLAMEDNLYRQESIKHATEAANLAECLSEGDLEYLDPALSICWSVIAEILAYQSGSLVHSAAISTFFPSGNDVERLLGNLEHLKRQFTEKYGCSLAAP